MTNPQAMPEPTPAERLDGFSLAALKTIAHNLEVKPAGGDRADYIGALAAFVGTPRHREILERRLSDDQWALVTLLPARLGPFTPRMMLSALLERGLQGRAAVGEAATLLAFGCLLPMDGSGPNKLGIDAGSMTTLTLRRWYSLAPGVGAWALERHQAALARPDSHRPPTDQPPGPVDPPSVVLGPVLAELQRAAFILLTEATGRPIRFTLQGAPYKNELARLAKALAGKTERGARRQSGAEAIPPLLWFALGALLGAGLLELDGQEARPSGEASGFLNRPIGEQAMVLLNGWAAGPYDDFGRIPTLFTASYGSRDYWLGGDDGYGHGPGHDRLARARVLVSTGIRVVTAPAPDAWYRLDDLARFVFHQYPEFLFDRWNDYEILQVHQFSFGVKQQKPRMPYTGVYRRAEQMASRTLLYMDTDWLEVEGAFVRQVVGEALRWLGLVEVGPDAERPDRFRLADLGQHLLLGQPLARPEARAAGKAIVQPSFEVVVVDAAASFGLLAQLDEFAERRTLDRAATYQLTQAALVRGLDRGWTGQRVLATLEGANGGPLPQNVRYSLQEWIRLYERLSVRERATLLEADDARQLDRWLADPHLGKLLGQRLGPTAVLVPARQADAVARRIGALAVVDYGQPPTAILSLREPDLVDIEAQKAEPYVRYRLEAFSAPVEEARGQIVYRITRETVGRAAAAGWQGIQLADFLTTAAGQAVPNDFLVRLLGWSGAIPPVSCEPLVALVLSSTSVGWETIRLIPSIGRLIRALPTPDLALVAPGDLEALRQELGARGLAVGEATLAERVLQYRTSTSLLRAARHGVLDDPLALLAAELGALGLSPEKSEKEKRRRWP